MSDENFQGTVSHWDGRSYGFLTPDNSTEGDIFFHVTAVMHGKAPKRGDRVMYNVVRDTKRQKLRAVLAY